VIAPVQEHGGTKRKEKGGKGKGGKVDPPVNESLGPREKRKRDDAFWHIIHFAR